MDSKPQETKPIKLILLYIICWTSGIIFIILAARHINLDEPEKVHNIFLTFLAAGLVLLLLPFFKKVKFGSVELEREIQEAKKEVGELRTEIRQQLSILSTNINTITKLNNQVNLYLPGTQEMKEEVTTIKEKLDNKQNEVEEIRNELDLPSEDITMAMAKMRIRIEFLLRSILEKRLSIKTSDKPVKFLTLNHLIKEFFKEYPDYEYLNRSFDYVNRIGNAAIHAQEIEYGQANEMLQLGANLIAILNKIYLKAPGN